MNGEHYEEKTPWNPSRRAMARVTGPVKPAPTTCHYCEGVVSIVPNSEIYGREYGDWPWAYLCEKCRAYVGMHPFTNIPLGTLADAPTREMRKLVKEFFNPRWERAKDRRKARTEAYSWLAEQLGIPIAECHIGWFDTSVCKKAITILKESIKK